MSARVEEHPAVAHAHGLALAASAWCAVIACDHPGCGAVYALAGDALDVADREARAIGWTHDGGEGDGCPLHPVARESAT